MVFLLLTLALCQLVQANTCQGDNCTGIIKPRGSDDFDEPDFRSTVRNSGDDTPCEESVRLSSPSPWEHYAGLYLKTDQESRGQTVWKLTGTESCLWLAIFDYWWLGPCRNVGQNNGLGYQDTKTKCPYDATEQVWKRGGSGEILAIKATKAVNCKVGDWKAWGRCSVTCGGGTKRRARDVIHVDMNRVGETCPALEETMACNTAQCPVDCKVGNWRPWTKCSVTCDGGTKRRARDVVLRPVNGGAACPDLEETMACNTEQCPLPCPGLGKSTSGATTTTGLDPLLALLIFLVLVCCKGCNNSCTFQGENKQSQ